MSRTRVIASLVILIMGAAFLAGYWPEHQRRVAFEGQAATLRAQLANAEARVRMARLLGEVLRVTEAVTALNYGEARELSSTFFDGVRAARTPVPSFKTALESILQRRDGVTAALSRGDQEAAELLAHIADAATGGARLPSRSPRLNRPTLGRGANMRTLTTAVATGGSPSR